METSILDLNKSRDFIDPTEHTKPIHIIGCGAIGSTLAENLARFGFEYFVLYDFDKVEPHNIANQMFTQEDIGVDKAHAVALMIHRINPAAKIKIWLEGYTTQPLSGYVFLCVDNIDLRRSIVEKQMSNPYIEAMFDFRMRLTDAQHYAANWNDQKMKDNLLNTMQFSHDDAKADTPVSACGITLSVNPTVRTIVAYGVANFINLLKGKELKKMIITYPFDFVVDAF